MFSGQEKLIGYGKFGPDYRGLKSASKFYVALACLFHPHSLYSMAAPLSLAQIAAHNTKKDIYVAVHNKVYNVTDFIEEVSSFNNVPDICKANHSDGHRS
jgi:cytochrome b involved in lipid metabolism